MKKSLKQLVEVDAIIARLPQLRASTRDDDDSHLSRRMQQRAVSWEMIKVAVAYGKKEYCNRALTFTLLDKNLRGTSYAPLTDSLRRLRVICREVEDSLRISTVYWAKDIRR